jgi:glycerophosphoryl diester phosphodiesterase
MIIIGIFVHPTLFRFPFLIFFCSVTNAHANQGADGFELDVLLSQDERTVVCHDVDLERLCGSKKQMHEVDYEPELKAMNVLSMWAFIWAGRVP